MRHRGHCRIASWLLLSSWGLLSCEPRKRPPGPLASDGGAGTGGSEPTAGRSHADGGGGVSAGGGETGGVGEISAGAGTGARAGSAGAGGTIGGGSDPGTPTAVATGTAHTCAVFDSGHLRCWGGLGPHLGFGHLDGIGDGIGPTIVAAGNVPVGKYVTRVTAGPAHTCAVVSGEAVRCWGTGADGRLGYDNSEHVAWVVGPSIEEAGDVAVGGAVVDVAAGDAHTCALLASSDVRCWGDNSFGQLGYDNTENVGDGVGPTIIEAGNVPLGARATAIAAARFRTCAILEDASVRCWGSGFLGYDLDPAVGDGIGPSIIDVGPVPTGGPVDMISLGANHSCVRLTDKRLRCWGDNSTGQLGLDDTTTVGGGTGGKSILDAGDVPVGGEVALIAAGGSHTCAVLESGVTRCWGFGLYGQLGYGNTFNVGDGLGTTITQAGDVDVGGTPTDIALGTNHTCALLAPGFVRCWGVGNWLGYNSQSHKGDDPGEMPPPGVPLR